MEITAKELQKYLGLLLCMSVCNFSRLLEKDVPFPATIMSRDGFMDITSNLHISDHVKDAASDRKKGTEDTGSNPCWTRWRLAAWLTTTKTTRWNMTVFQHLLDIAVTNCFILHRELCVSKTSPERPGGACCTAFRGSHGWRAWALKSRAFSCSHEQWEMGKTQRASTGRKQCTVFERSSPWKCQRCSVGLCLQPERNCFFLQGPETPGLLQKKKHSKYFIHVHSECLI